jgi:hypothetical protein
MSIKSIQNKWLTVAGLGESENIIWCNLSRNLCLELLLGGGLDL